MSIMIKCFAELGRYPKAGDRVKIKDEPTGPNWNLLMNRHLSCVMTVRDCNEYGRFCKMEEDINEFHGNTAPGWDWYFDAIEGLVIEDAEDILEDTSVWTHGASLEALLT